MGRIRPDPHNPLAGLTVAYATIDDMRERFGEACLNQLAPPDLPDPGDAEGPGDPALLAALKDASETVDAYAAGRYKTPLNPVPGPVTRWTCDIARWYLDRSRTDEAIRKAYEDAIQGLKDMAKGVIVFACDGVESQSAPSGGIEATGPARFFSARSLEGF